MTDNSYMDNQKVAKTYLAHMVGNSGGVLAYNTYKKLAPRISNCPENVFEAYENGRLPDLEGFTPNLARNVRQALDEATGKSKEISDIVLGEKPSPLRRSGIGSHDHS